MAYMGKREWLSRIRTNKGYSQALTAAMSDISLPTYSQIELGYRNPSEKMMASIAATLGFTYEDFVREEKAAGRKFL